MGFFGKLWKKSDASQSSAEAAVAPSAPAKTTYVSSYLTEKSICFLPPNLNKQEALAHLMGLMELANPAAALKAVMDREAAGPTVIAPGIAVPHARVEGLSGIVATVGISLEGVFDPAAESGNIKLFILFVGPTGNMKEHLGFLASVASLFQLEGFGESLLQQITPAQVLEKIKQAEKTI